MEMERQVLIGSNSNFSSNRDDSGRKTSSGGYTNFHQEKQELLIFSNSNSSSDRDDSGRKRSSGGDDNGDGRTLFAAPIPRNWDYQYINRLFIKYGDLADDLIIHQDLGGRRGPRGGYCIVKYTILEDADRAIAALDQKYKFRRITPIKVVKLMNKDSTEEELVKGRDNPLEVPFTYSKKPRTGESRPLSHSDSESNPNKEKLSDDDDDDYIDSPLHFWDTDDEDSTVTKRMSDYGDGDLELKPIGAYWCKPVLLDESGHKYFDRLAKYYIQHYNEKENASYEFVELVMVATQQRPKESYESVELIPEFRPTEFYHTIKARNSVDGSVEIFQFKTSFHVDGLETVDEYKISDVPYAKPCSVNIPRIIRGYEDMHRRGPHHRMENGKKVYV